MTHGFATACLACLACAGAFAAERVELDPDSPQTHALAREALSRADVRPISGAQLQIAGIQTAISGGKDEVSGLLRELNAEVRGREIRISLSADVMFDFDKAELKGEARPSLEKVAAVLKSYPGASARIEGHTDAKGDEAYNQKLSERRAEAVRKWLADNGATMKMAVAGYGKKRPVAPNTRPDGKDDPEGRQKNRRVEVLVEGASAP